VLEAISAHDMSRKVPEESFTCDARILIFIIIFIPSARSKENKTRNVGKKL
jgi:hypothetical protein